MSVMEFDEALAVVLERARGLGAPGAVEVVTLQDALGRVLAEDVRADRDQPPFARSTRDGFAVTAAAFAAGVALRVVGEVRAGEKWAGGPIGEGEAVKIMTGAPLPVGVDAVAMVEFVGVVGNGVKTAAGRALVAGENVVPPGAEARAGQVVIAAGTVVGAAEIGLAATCGRAELTVFARPAVAILATGDELIEVGSGPLEEQQIWNSNGHALRALVSAAGGCADKLAIARDTLADVAESIAAGRKADLIILSGGVSMGEYDLVEEVLAALSAEFFFTGVRMQPGKPVVFGRLPARDGAQACFFFGLPGNPVSTQVTFHCFVEPFLKAMAGGAVEGPAFVQATLAEGLAGKAGLMRMLPARLTRDRVRPEVRLVPWQGSGDLAANARANGYAVLPPREGEFVSGEVISVLLR